MRNILTVLYIGLTLPLLQGCVPAALVGGTASVGSTLAEDRKMTEVLSDTQIRTVINAKWFDHDPEISKMVGLQVRQGRVLLTGLVDTPMRQIDAVRLAWEAKGVTEVIDETQVGESTLGLYAGDSWITTKLGTEMLFTQDISSVNYNIKTVNGVVYLIGTAQNQQELDRVIDMARRVSGVKNVVNYVRLKDGSPGQGGQAFPTGDSSSYVREEAPIPVQPISGSMDNNPSFPAPRAM